MNYKILPTKEFEKDFKKLDSPIKIRIKKKRKKQVYTFNNNYRILNN